MSGGLGATRPQPAGGGCEDWEKAYRRLDTVLLSLFSLQDPGCLSGYFGLLAFSCTWQRQICV